MTTLSTQSAQPDSPSDRARLTGKLVVYSLSIICMLSTFWLLQFTSRNWLLDFILPCISYLIGALILAHAAADSLEYVPTPLEYRRFSFWSSQNFFSTIALLLFGLTISAATGTYLQMTFLAAQPAYQALPETVAYRAVLSDDRAVQGQASRVDLFCLIKTGANGVRYVLPVIFPGPGQLLSHPTDSVLIRSLSIDPAIRARFQATPQAALNCRRNAVELR